MKKHSGCIRLGCFFAIFNDNTLIKKFLLLRSKIGNKKLFEDTVQSIRRFIPTNANNIAKNFFEK